MKREIPLSFLLTLFHKSDLLIHMDLPNLDSREEMLKTLKMAYRNLIDESEARIARQLGTGIDHPPRLSQLEQRDLGRRIALYWDIEPSMNPPPPDWLVERAGIGKTHIERLQELFKTPTPGTRTVIENYS